MQSVRDQSLGMCVRIRWCVDHEIPEVTGASPQRNEPTAMSPIAGKLVTEAFEYDGGRQVTAYVPPAPPEAIVFAGDSQLIVSCGDALEAADLPPTMII